MKKRAPILDPRLLIGIALVAASVGGVWALVAAVDESVEVYAASEALAPGDRLRAGDVDVVRARPDASTDLYLAPGGIPSGGLVVTRTVGEGELVPLSAVGSADGIRLTSVVVSVDGQLAASIDAGSTVDVWAARESESGEFDAPATIVAGALVVRLVESETIVGAGETTAIEVLVPKSKVARVLESLANSDAISIVPAALPAARG